MNPLISIIMPVYNNERYLPMAVDSVLSQSFEDFELIIVDDGSTDNTPKIADDIAARDPRVRVIHQKNQWIYASMNNGVAAATGEYVYFINSDDTLWPDALSHMAQLVKKYAPDVVWTRVSTVICDEHLKELKRIDPVYHGGNQPIYYPNKDAVRDAWIGLMEMALVLNEKNLYRASLAKKHTFRNDIYGADNLYNTEIASCINTAVICPFPTYRFSKFADGRNTSSHYYEYMHSMMNEFYLSRVQLFNEWGRYSKENAHRLAVFRLKDFNREISFLLRHADQLSPERRIRVLMTEVANRTVFSCADLTDRREEIESRILSACLKLTCLGEISPSSEVYFVFEMLTSLLRFEKNAEDLVKIRDGVCHVLNPMCVGKGFYDRIKANSAWRDQ